MSTATHLQRLLYFRRPLIVAIHLMAVVLSNYLAFWLRFEGQIPPAFWAVLVEP